MNKKLKEIASVQMGYSFRSRLESMETGNTAVIQMRDLSADNRVDCSSLLRIGMDNIKEQHLTKPGDLIFRSRGQVMNSAILIDDPGMAVVAAPLLRIRISNDGVLPEYLNWYINQAPVQALLNSCAEGTSQKMISKQVLEEIDVDIPPLAIQKMIMDIATLAEEEQLLLEKIAEKRRQYLTSTLVKLAKGD